MTWYARLPQALASARLVQLHQPLGAATPGSVLPMLVSPAGTDEPGATPMRDSTNSRAGPLGRLEHMDAPGSPLGGGRSAGREMLAPGRLARLAAANAAALNLHDLVRGGSMAKELAHSSQPGHSSKDMEQRGCCSPHVAGLSSCCLTHSG